MHQGFQLWIFTKIFTQDQLYKISSFSHQKLLYLVKSSGRIYYQLIHTHTDKQILEKTQVIKKGSSLPYTLPYSHQRISPSLFQKQQRKKPQNLQNFFNESIPKSKFISQYSNQQETYFHNYENILLACKTLNKRKRLYSQRQPRQSQSQLSYLQINEDKNTDKNKDNNTDIDIDNFKKTESQQQFNYKNMWMHLLNMKTKSLLAKKQPNLKSCKRLLKQFIDKEHLLNLQLKLNHFYDAVLLAITFSNLGVLYKKQNKPFKSLLYFLKCIQCCYIHKAKIKLHIQVKVKQNKKQEKRQIIIILVNSLSLAKSTLTKILKNQSKSASTSTQKKQSNDQTYANLYGVVNQLGFRYSNKYLGENSHFSHKFVKPKFQQQKQKYNKTSEISFEQIILSSLQKIENILLQKKQKQEVSCPNIDIQEQAQKLILKSYQPQSKSRYLLKPKKLQRLELKSQISHHIDIQQSNYEQSSQESKNDEQKYAYTYANNMNILPINSIKHTEEIQKEIQGQILQKQTIMIGDWSLQIEFFSIQKVKDEKLKCFNQNPMYKSKSLHSNNRYLRFFAKNLIKKLKFTQDVYQDKLKKILTLINLENTLPYEYSGCNLPKNNFISHCILPYIDIVEINKKNVEFKQIEHIQHQNRNTNRNIKLSEQQQQVQKQEQTQNYKHLSYEVKISPTSKGFMPPIQFQFMKVCCFVFFNHVRSNNFRLCIAPKLQAKCIYLNLVLNQDTMSKYFQIQQSRKQFIEVIQKAVSKQKQSFNNSKAPKFTVLSQDLVLDFMKKILTNFQQFLIQSQESDESVQFQNILNAYNDTYFQFRQKEPDFQVKQKGPILTSTQKQSKKGIFFKVYYNQNQNSFQIYAQNNYKSYGVKQKIKAKGNDVYYEPQLQKQFGIKLKQKKPNQHQHQHQHQSYSQQLYLEKVHKNQQNYLPQNQNTLQAQQKIPGSSNKQIQHKHNIASRQKQQQQILMLPFNQKLLSELICLKYDLVCFERPLSTDQEDQFNQNSIVKYQANCQSFRVEVVSINNANSTVNRNYQKLLPLSICLMVVNNSVPIGLKVECYDPQNVEKCFGCFVYLCDSDWKISEEIRKLNKVSMTTSASFPKSDMKNTKNSSQMFIDYVSTYKFENDYFINKWLKKKGFREVFELILSQKSPICLQDKGSNNQVYILDQLIKQIIQK